MGSSCQGASENKMDNPPNKMDYSLIPMKSDSPDFSGQRIVVLHPAQRARAARLDLLRSFHPTDIGYYPAAAGHLRERPDGSPQTIFIRCAAGAGWCQTGGSRYEARANDLLIIPVGQPHSYGASETDPWTIEWFHAAGKGIAEYLGKMGFHRRSPVLRLRPEAWDSPLFDEALSTLEAGFTDLHLIQASKALEHLLARLVIRLHKQPTFEASFMAKMEEAVSFLRSHFDQPLTAPGLASRFGFSTSHFTSLFLQHTGHSPIDYLIRVRISRACSLLDMTSLSIQEIAARTGYGDPYYFSRIFKKVTGLSPKSYRSSSKG